MRISKKYDHALIASLYASGVTLREIGSRYGVCKERMRQVIKQFNLGDSASCGAAKRGLENRKKHEAAVEKRHLDRWGFSKKERREQEAFYRKLGKQSPYRAYSQQKKNAHGRSIEWGLTFSQWLHLWGHHLLERGAKSGGLVMCRYGDCGPYRLGNVYIATANHNHSAWRKWKDTGCKFEKTGFTSAEIIVMT